MLLVDEMLILDVKKVQLQMCWCLCSILRWRFERIAQCHFWVD